MKIGLNPGCSLPIQLPVNESSKATENDSPSTGVPAPNSQWGHWAANQQLEDLYIPLSVNE